MKARVLLAGALLLALLAALVIAGAPLVSGLLTSATPTATSTAWRPPILPTLAATATTPPGWWDQALPTATADIEEMTP